MTASLHMAFLKIVILVFISGCAVAPFNTPTTGRTLGKNKSELNFGLSPGLFVSGTYGVFDRLDVGASAEVQFGIGASGFTKLAVIDSENSSLGIYGGGFAMDSKINSTGYFVGPIYSYRHKDFEPFIGSYFTYIEFQQLESRDDVEDFNDLFHDIAVLFSDGHVKYLDSSIGFNYWVSNETKFYLYGKNIYLLEYSYSKNNIWLAGLGFGFKMGQ